MAALGDIGRAMSVTACGRSHGMFGRNAAAPVTIVITGAIPGMNLFLVTQSGMVIDQNSADEAGEAKFHDMDNGIYTVSSAGNGDVWQATVTAGAASVVKIFTGNRAMARAWIG